MIRHNRFRNNLFRNDWFRGRGSGAAPAVFAGLLLAGALLAAGCGSEPDSVTLDDLTAEETDYLTRFVTLERARAVTFEDRTLGNALLDSLAAAWGDSALTDALGLLPDDPDRLAAIHVLLEQVLEAEADSLIANPLGVPLDAPLRVPEPEPEEDPAPEAEAD